jgi:hypothetical protein
MATDGYDVLGIDVGMPFSSEGGERHSIWGHGQRRRRVPELKMNADLDSLLATQLGQSIPKRKSPDFKL